VTTFAVVFLRTIAASGAAALAVGANLDYLRDVARHRTRPRLASWVIWTGAMAIGAAGAARVRQWPSAALGVAGAGTSGAVLIFGWGHSTREIGWLDFAAGISGGAGLVLVTESGMGMVPAGAGITAAVLADLAAFTLTFRNARAGGESPRPYLLYALAGLLALAASTSPAGMIYPAYEATACGACAVIAWRARSGCPAGLEAADAETAVEDDIAATVVQQRAALAGFLEAVIAKHPFLGGEPFTVRGDQVRAAGTGVITGPPVPGLVRHACAFRCRLPCTHRDSLQNARAVATYQMTHHTASRHTVTLPANVAGARSSAHGRTTGCLSGPRNQDQSPPPATEL
jgi:hypothetical protein